MIEVVENIIITKVTLLPYYFLFGLLFMIIFFLFFKGRIDNFIKGSSWGFYLVITPSIVILWPIVLLLLLKRK